MCHTPEGTSTTSPGPIRRHPQPCWNASRSPDRTSKRSATAWRWTKPPGAPNGRSSSSRRGGMEVELLDRALAQLDLADLARDRHRELRDHAHVAGDLVVGDLPLAER